MCFIVKDPVKTIMKQDLIFVSENTIKAEVAAVPDCGEAV